MTRTKVAPKLSPIYADPETFDLAHKTVLMRSPVVTAEYNWQNIFRFESRYQHEPAHTWNMLKNQSMKYENYGAKNPIQSCLPYGGPCLMFTAHTSVSGTTWATSKCNAKHICVHVFWHKLQCNTFQGNTGPTFLKPSNINSTSESFWLYLFHQKCLWRSVSYQLCNDLPRWRKIIRS